MSGFTDAGKYPQPEELTRNSRITATHQVAFQSNSYSNLGCM
jgi:hypothetical protein